MLNLWGLILNFVALVQKLIMPTVSPTYFVAKDILVGLQTVQKSKCLQWEYKWVACKKQGLLGSAGLVLFGSLREADAWSLDYYSYLFSLEKFHISIKSSYINECKNFATFLGSNWGERRHKYGGKGILFLSLVPLDFSKRFYRTKW